LILPSSFCQKERAAFSAAFLISIIRRLLWPEAGGSTRRDSHGDQAHQRTEHFDQGLFHLHLLLSPLWAFALSLLLALW